MFEKEFDTATIQLLIENHKNILFVEISGIKTTLETRESLQPKGLSIKENHISYVFHITPVYLFKDYLTKNESELINIIKNCPLKTIYYIIKTNNDETRNRLRFLRATIKGEGVEKEEEIVVEKH